LESRADRSVAVAFHGLLVEQFIASFDGPPTELILDFDATDDPVHGCQEGRFFHGYYDSHCFLPLYVFCGDRLLVSYLRPSNIDGARHAWRSWPCWSNAFARNGRAADREGSQALRGHGTQAALVRQSALWCPHLSRHYARVLEDMEALAARDSNLLDAAYVEKARGGLQRWVDGGEAGHLAWGVFHFRR